jgi:SAM-dependent methyltransferase
MPELDRDTARQWVERWDRQQEESLPDREDRFTALIDAVEEGWTARLGLGDRAPDAAVSTTALHWLPEPELRGLYAELAAVLRPGGLLLDGDHFILDAKESPVLARLDQALRQREDKRRFPGGHPENWHDWWDAAAADPALAGYVAERARRRVEAGHHESQSTMLATHVEALRAAGFAEVGTLWQRGDNRLLCAVSQTATA